jgi:DNA-binding MarR family transcriptional regulator
MAENPETDNVNEVNKPNTNTKLDEVTVEGTDSRYKATIIVFHNGYEEKVLGSKVVRRNKLKFAIVHGGIGGLCEDDCEHLITTIAQATRYKIPKKVLNDAVNQLRQKYGTVDEIPIVDYVRQRYPDEFEKITKDPFNWILEKANSIPGYEKLKITLMLTLASLRLRRVEGVNRVNVIVVGDSRAGKSVTVKSVLRYIEGADFYMDNTKLTPNSLIYQDIDTFDGKLLFIEQIDKQNIFYLREAMSEDKICVTVTEIIKTREGHQKFKSSKYCIPGQPALVTTSVADDIDVDRQQLYNRAIKIYVNPDFIPLELRAEAMVNTTKKPTPEQITEFEKTRMVLLAWFYWVPDDADITGLKDKIIGLVKELDEIKGVYSNTAMEIIRNLLRAIAVSRGKTKADDDDWEFMLKYYKFDIFANALGLSERDVLVLEAIDDTHGVVIRDIIDRTKIQRGIVEKILAYLKEIGFVDVVKDEKGFIALWSLTEIGKKVRDLMIKLNTERVNSALNEIKERGLVSVRELVGYYGEFVLRKLKENNLIKFEHIKDEQYVQINKR